MVLQITHTMVTCDLHYTKPEESSPEWMLIDYLGVVNLSISLKITLSSKSDTPVANGT